MHWGSACRTTSACWPARVACDVKSGEPATSICRRSRRVSAEQRRRAGPPVAEPFHLPPGIRHVTLIHLLVSTLAHPEAEPAALARRLRAAGETLDASTVRAIFAFYGLEAKKNA